MSTFLILVPIFLPLVLGLMSYLFKFKSEFSRRLFYIALITITSIIVWTLLIKTPNGKITIMNFTDTLAISFKIDGMSKIFAAISATLWPLTTLYAFDYMKHEERKNMFFAFFTATFGVTIGIAFSSNLLTMYLFYELLTLSTIPLVMYSLTPESIAAGKKYMIYSFGGAAFAFVGLSYIIYCGLSDFSLGGFLIVPTSENGIALLLYLFAFVGFGVKAAIFPLHGWLPSASIAPTPVTALLHAVAVVKAGAFATIRLTYYTYDVEFLKGTWVQTFLLILTSITIIFGSCMALKERHFKRRMAYSTVSNLSYILFAVVLMSNAGLLAAILHMGFHSLIKILAFFAVGAAMHYSNKIYVDQLNGIAKYMPITFGVFFVSSLALTGVPPLNGFVSKWYILTAAVSEGSSFAIFGVAVLLISALLTAIYMMSIVLKAYFPSQNADLTCNAECKEAGPLMTVPMIILAFSVVLSGLFSGQLIALIEKVVF